VSDRAARLERLDAYAQIRDLAVRYAAAMATHDRETLGLLYVDDVRVGGGLTGREALREAYFGSALDRLEISVLHAGTHVINLDAERLDRATGSVYTLGQIKFGERWIRQAICYFDRYAKRDGEWLFVTRDHQLFYGADHDQRPNELPPAHWPASDTGTGTLPFGWPTWRVSSG
jgi:SnoaL-like domain